ncbi:MAG TPA: AAA family ATPase [Leptolyngbyaceae cyanobacterium M33_DOE_097]|uniref:histidine kinase n=1 Tax=Oscillatoriales cyanobacterium SpSt-418 TaxID=2282169 RepID=A0A7C3KC72_9CYAN|nr:AAA family ATPase [Leptolyngbyaceae cyanobacterium M33_DOE_097]
MAATQAIQLSGYQVLKRIYSSTKTHIYRAERETDRQPVIIKLLQNEYPSFTELAQFRNQYTIAKNLDLPEVIQTYSLEPHGNGYALVMEDFGGVSLKALLAQWQAQDLLGTPKHLKAFFDIAVQVASGLNGLYRNRIIHKDIKPDNILIHLETQQVKLIDFSIASLLPREAHTPASPTVLEGTLAYLSPEQTGRMNRTVDYRTDFYSLGVTFYELLTGRLPFQSEDSIELIHCHLAKQPPAIESLNPAIPTTLAEIVNKLMAKNAEDRYQSALGLKYDLERCQQKLATTGEIAPFALGCRDVSDRFTISEKLYGRQVDVEALLAAYDRIAQGRSEALLVAGFSGIGKTAIINEVHKPIAQGTRYAHAKQRGYFIKGKFDQFQRNVPLSAIVQAFRDLIGQLLKESQAQIDCWKLKLLDAVGENGQIVIDVIPEVELLIGKQSPVAPLDAIATQNRLLWVFQKFIQVFPSATHPLVIFLDDLQWADSASLNLIQSLMSESDMRYLLLLGAYRDNEVTSVHPLMQTLSEIQAANTVVNTITLAPLSLQDLNALVADTLHCSTETAYPLTQLIFTKTKGNPFFSNQFLKTLHESELITFDFDAGIWQWDMAQVQALSLTDDVVEFMAAQLQKLPESTQDMLKLAACIGNQFDLKTLATVSSQSPTETANQLWEALQSGLILPGSSGYHLFQSDPAAPETIASKEHTEWVTTGAGSPTIAYQFLHDRVQQAAYLLIPDAQKALTHLKIGRLLLKKTSPQEREEKIFEIVNQLNYGVALIEQPAERNELAHLNLIAAQKAIATTAYTMAATYATTGIQLLPGNAWQRQYVLTLALHEAAVTATGLCGDFEQMEQCTETLLQHAQNPLDCVRAYETKIQAYTSQNRLLDAIAIARQALELFGIHISDAPQQSEVQHAFQETANHLVGKSTEDLLNLPLMTDAKQLAIVRLASSMVPPAFIAAPQLLPLVVLLQVNLMAQAGNTPLSAFVYANYSLLLSSALQDVEAADRFGKLALNLAKKFNSEEIKVRTYYVLGAFIVHGKAHIHETLPLLLESYQSGLETGNLEFVGYSAKEICNHSYLIGQNLISLEEKMHAYTHVLASLKQTTCLTYCQLYWQATLNLLGKAENPLNLSGEAMQEETMLPLLQAANDMSGLHYFYLHKLILAYLFEDYQAAIAQATTAQQYLSGGNGFITLPTFYFYDSLSALAVIPDHLADREILLARVASNQAQLQRWADNAPMNYRHKYDLVEAERHRIMGDFITAMEYYDLALSLARENEYLNDEALTNELTSKFYLQWGKDTVAQAYLTSAYQAYERWGAKAKLKVLEQNYPELLMPVIKQKLPKAIERLVEPLPMYVEATQNQKTTTHSSSISESLDLATVLKATQVLSGEIQLEKLLTRLMQVVLENAGAQTGALMLFHEEELVIQAQATRTHTEVGQEAIQTTSLQAIPVHTSPAVPITLINYVSRTQKTLVIDDATTETHFADDPYLSQHQPKSVLCTPLRRQGRLVGVLYLENNLTRGAFTRDRLQVLKLLTTQATISLENALLYENLAEANERLEDYNSTLELRVAERTQELNQKTQHLEQTLQELQSTQTQLIQAEKMSSLGQLVAGVAHEINNPVNFIHGNLVHTRKYVEDLLNVIATYQTEYPAENAAVDAVKQEIELDFVIEDLPKIIHSMQVGSDRIRQIVLGLRNFSRLDEAEMKPVDIHEGIDSALMILQHRLKARPDTPSIEIVKEYSQLPNVECYAGQLNQVFMNILSNAIDALDGMSDRSTSPQICISTQQLNSEAVEICIADNGQGMPESVMQKIFDPFFTTKPVGSGTGLGLSICYQIVVDKHGGRLSCDSQPGQGTTFKLEVPIKNKP